MISEKIAQLISSKATGSSFLKTLGLEEEPHLLVPLVSAMSRVKQLQTLAEEMSALMTDKQGIFFFPHSINTHVVTAGVAATCPTQDTASLDDKGVIPFLCILSDVCLVPYCISVDCIERLFKKI